MSTVKVKDQAKGLVYQANVMVLQETRVAAVNALDVVERACVGREFQKLSAEQRNALREVRTLLIDLKPKEAPQS
jgi:hypothetical protein